MNIEIHNASQHNLIMLPTHATLNLPPK